MTIQTPETMSFQWWGCFLGVMVFEPVPKRTGRILTAGDRRMRPAHWAKAQRPEKRTQFQVQNSTSENRKGKGQRKRQREREPKSKSKDKQKGLNLGEAEPSYWGPLIRSLGVSCHLQETSEASEQGTGIVRCGFRKALVIVCSNNDAWSVEGKRLEGGSPAGRSDSVETLQGAEGEYCQPEWKGDEEVWSVPYAAMGWQMSAAGTNYQHRPRAAGLWSLLNGDEESWL